jgi:hypothetical protein
MNDHSFAFQRLLDRVDQLEMKLQLMVTEVIKLRDQVRVFRGAHREPVVDLNSESYTVAPIETEESQESPE